MKSWTHHQNRWLQLWLHNKALSNVMHFQNGMELRYMWHRLPRQCNKKKSHSLVEILCLLLGPHLDAFWEAKQLWFACVHQAALILLHQLWTVNITLTRNSDHVLKPYHWALHSAGRVWNCWHSALLFKQASFLPWKFCSWSWFNIFFIDKKLTFGSFRAAISPQVRLSGFVELEKTDFVTRDKFCLFPSDLFGSNLTISEIVSSC